MTQDRYLIYRVGLFKLDKMTVDFIPQTVLITGLSTGFEVSSLSLL